MYIRTVSAYAVYRMVATLLGSVLLIGGALKIHAISINERGIPTVPIPRWVSVEFLVIELCLGCWLLSGRKQLQAWAASLAIFSVLAAVALSLAIAGTKVCPCFGYLSVNPRVVLFFDLAAVLGLSLFPRSVLRSGIERNSGSPSISLVRPLASLAVVACATGLLLTTGILAHHRSVASASGGSRPKSHDILRRHWPAVSTFFLLSGVTIPDTPPAGLSVPILAQDLDSGRLSAIATGGAVTTATITRVDANKAISNPASGLTAPLLILGADKHLQLLLATSDGLGSRFWQVIDTHHAPRLISDIELSRQHFTNAWTHSTSPCSSGIPLGRSTVECDHIVHNFGIDPPLDRVSARFVIHNRGPDRIIVKGSPWTSCGCVTTSLTGDVPVESGGAVECFVTIRPSPDSVGGFMQRVRLSFCGEHDTGKMESIELRLIGTLTPSLVVVPREITYGRAISMDSEPRVVRISEVPSDRFDVISIDFGDLANVFTPKIATRTKPTGLRDFIIKLAPIQNAGALPTPLSGKLQVNTNSRKVPNIVIPIRGPAGHRPDGDSK